MFRRKAVPQVEHINVTRIELSDESRQARDSHTKGSMYEYRLVRTGH